MNAVLLTGQRLPVDTSTPARMRFSGNSEQKPVLPLPLTPQVARPVYPKRKNWGAVAAIVIAHVLGILALLQMDSVRQQFKKATPLMVSLISESKPEKPLETQPAPKKLMMVHSAIVPPILPPVVEIDHPQPQTQPTISVIEARQTPTAPEVNLGPVKPPEIVPPNFVAAYLDNPAPSYPPLARRMREQGTVVLRVMVTPDGHADRVEIQTSSGSSRLDASAQATVAKWRFVPAKQGTQAVASWVLVPIDFQLTS